MSATPPSSLPHYAELFCMTNFSFLQGASHAEELVARAIQLDYTALAITDECSLAGVVRAHGRAKEAKWYQEDHKQGQRLLIGSWFRLTGQGGGEALSLLAIAKNRDGYGNLSEMITLGRTRAAKGEYLLHADDFAAPPPDRAHLRGLPGCLLVLLPAYPVWEPADVDRLHAQAAWMAATFGERAWLGLTLLQRAFDEGHRQSIEEVAAQHGLPVVAAGQVCMHVRSRKPLHDTLSAIRLGKPVADCGYALAQNAEQHLRSRVRLANVYPRAALAETVRIARQCTFSLDELRYEYPSELIPAGHTPASYLRQETYLGAQARYPDGIPATVQRQVEEELELVAELRYEYFFLTVYDIVRFARKQEILCQGRGSAANSAVCYCLGITEVNPVESTLLMGRFISRERDEPPDIDVDFEHQRREEVIQYIYAKYGRHRAALAATVICYRPKSALRDAGKALGVDLAIVEKVARSHHWFDSKHELLNRFAECGLDPDAPLANQWASLAQRMLGFPRHLSQHVGGFVIAQDKLSRLVPIENATMKDRSVIQWDKDDLEELGLLKVDVLALGMLSALRRALHLIGVRRGEPFRMQDIPRDDAATYDMMCEADTVGVFQIESRAQMTMLPRLRPRRFYDLVIEVALVRPGPIQGGMVHPYLQRRLDPTLIDYPVGLEAALERTLGVPIFQEQVMQVAMIAAGFSQGEADQLRRAMAAWKRKGGMDKYRGRIIQGMLDRDYDIEFAHRICEQIQGFGEYGFPESHAASFALLTYVSSWIKCHEPAAFLCALLNSQPMGFYGPSQLVQDAKRHGVEVRPVDITASGWDSTLEEREEGDQPAVRLGMSLLRGMRFEAAERIEQARALRPFADVADLARRAQLDRHDLQVLAAANALRGLAGHRRQALWEAVGAVPDKDLLRPTRPLEEAPVLRAPGEGDDIIGDYRSHGLTLGRHPLALLRPQLLEKRFLPAEVLNTFADGQLARGAGIVTVRQRPGTAKGVLFITIEDETGNVNVIVRPDLVDAFRREVLGASLLGVYGVWQQEGIVRHLVAKRLVDLSPLLGELPTSSRDFC
ncbi:DNA polymerase III subunit alpha [Massilia dura]|uniref:Error-prone DNA polymerase n=1 Tax=Pseudoduganella dura TaxID=321982 RepID=A0A6I3XEC5_9BURK|nr:error-prone DNA polymerase [Pseudoduganella dura]MUI14809.1 DNA polymerase III subunit alpha [Pseudoduganella dura]GGY20981.1 error-prone DNA polymerase [Pseudoduganella dura]